MICDQWPTTARDTPTRTVATRHKNAWTNNKKNFFTFLIFHLFSLTTSYLAAMFQRSITFTRLPDWIISTQKRAENRLKRKILFERELMQKPDVFSGFKRLSQTPKIVNFTIISIAHFGDFVNSRTWPILAKSESNKRPKLSSNTQIKTPRFHEVFYLITLWTLN